MSDAETTEKTGKPEKEWKSGSDRWQGWLKRFWWLRGIAAAMTMAALVPQFIDVSRYEFLASFHAMIVGWNEVCRWIGSIVGEIPFLPDLSDTQVSTIVFATTVGVPVAINFYVQRRFARTEKESYSKFTENFFEILLCIFPIVFLVLFYHSLVTVGLPRELVSILIFIPGALLFIGSWVWAILVLHGYGRGVLYSVTFILMMELLYMLNTPWLADQIRNLPCELQSPPPAHCQAPATPSGTGGP